MAKKKTVKTGDQPAPKKKRKYLSQADVPSVSLEKALRVSRAIIDNYGSDPAKPLDVASALGIQPTTGVFRTLCGASIAYGLTTGGYNASSIELQPLATRIVTPRIEGDDLAAKREALLRPRIMREFLEKYDSKPLPQLHNIVINVLVGMGVPQKKAESAYTIIIDNANSVGFTQDIGKKKYIKLAGTAIRPTKDADANEIADGQEGIDAEKDEPDDLGNSDLLHQTNVTQEPQEVNRRVYIAHGKNKDFVGPITKLLSYGEMTAVVSVDKQSVSKPVPEKVMGDMRSCSAAIIHIADEQRLIDQDANEHVLINSNVLIEIGAAMALYGSRFILLVKDGIKLPSNLQGLYEVRYEGDVLDGNATMGLLEAIKDIKNNPLPARYAKSVKSEDS